MIMKKELMQIKAKIWLINFFIVLFSVAILYNTYIMIFSEFIAWSSVTIIINVLLGLNILISLRLRKDYRIEHRDNIKRQYWLKNNK